MTLVGDVSVGDANAMYAADGRISFEDYSVPEDSPLCYGYWVRAYDQAGNLYAGDRGCPPTRGVPLRTAAREDAAAGAGDDRPAGPQQRSPRRVDLLSGPGSPRLPRVPLGRRSSTRRSSSPASSRTARSARRRGQGSCRRATTCPPCPIRSPLAAPTSTPPPSRIASTGTASRRSIGSATRASGAHLDDIPASSTFTYTTDLPVTPSVLPPVPAASDGLRPRGQLEPAVRPRHAPGLRRVPGCDGRPVPAGVRDPHYEQLHRPLRAAWRRLPLLRPVDRPQRPPLRTLTAGPAPVLTSERRPTWASSTSSTPSVTAGRS